MLARQSHEVGPLPHVVAQSVRGFVGLEHGRQQAVLVQALNPLAIAFVGLGPAFDLASELRRGHDRLNAGLQQGEEQHVPVDAAGFERHGGDPARTQPGDELTQSRRVGREFAHGVGPVGRGIDANPVRRIADVDAGGMRVLDRHRRDLGAFLGVAPSLLAEPTHLGGA